MAAAGSDHLRHAVEHNSVERYCECAGDFQLFARDRCNTDCRY
jgi:hypothetical protein